MKKIKLTELEIRSLAAIGAMSIDRKDLAIPLMKNKFIMTIEFKFRDYIFTLKPDNQPTIKVKTSAHTIYSAIHNVCEAENCPESAIKNIKIK